MRLGENISELMLGIDPLNLDVTFRDMGAKVVILDGEMLCSWPHLGAFRLLPKIYALGQRIVSFHCFEASPEILLQ